MEGMMLTTEKGRSEFTADFASMGFDLAGDADLQGEWLAGFLHSRDLAACVVEVIGGGDDLDYVFLAVSPAFDEVTGLCGAVGRSMRSLRPDHEQYWFDLYARVADTGEPCAFEHTARAFGRCFHGYASRVGAAHSRRVCVVFENCATAAGGVGLVPMEGDARLERFGATLAHELRGPLAALYNGLHIVKRGTLAQEEARWALAMMERQLVRLSAFVDDLLDVGRLGSSNLRVERDLVSLNHVITESIDACAAAIDARRQELVVDADGADLTVRGDARRLIQVFTNLLANSIKYTPPGGHIRISLSKAEDHAKVQVSDDGSGISAEDLPHVFDYFKQGGTQPDQSRSGLGIGLSIVRSIVKLHGGRVSAHSDGTGTGSTFIVSLPLGAHRQPGLMPKGSAPPLHDNPGL